MRRREKVEWKKRRKYFRVCRFSLKLFFDESLVEKKKRGKKNQHWKSDSVNFQTFFSISTFSHAEMENVLWVSNCDKLHTQLQSACWWFFSLPSKRQLKLSKNEKNHSQKIFLTFLSFSLNVYEYYHDYRHPSHSAHIFFNPDNCIILQHEF